MPNRESNSDPISFDQLFNSAEAHFNNIWNSIASQFPPHPNRPFEPPNPPPPPVYTTGSVVVPMPDLGEVQNQLNNLANKVWNGLTMNGALLPGKEDVDKAKKVVIEWKYDSNQSPKFVHRQTVSPPSSSKRCPLVIRILTSPFVFIYDHPILSSFLIIGSSIPLIYFLKPEIIPSLNQRLPRFLTLPPPKPSRPVAHPQNAARLEAFIILGCDPNSLGEFLAIEYSKRGFVVFSTVSNPSYVDSLEKKGRGWVKALVLEGGEINSIQPFLRSLGSAVGLRFPVGSPGSTFVANPNREGVTVTGVIDALMLGDGTASHGSEGYYPLEGLTVDAVQKNLADPLTFEILLLKTILPILRRTSHNPLLSDVPRVYLTLLPSNTANASLPFVSLQSARDRAVISLLESARRELDVADWGRENPTTTNSEGNGSVSLKGEKISLKVVLVGNVKPYRCSPGTSPVRPKSPAASTLGLNHQSINLTPSLEALYGPALGRRLRGFGARRVYTQRGRKGSSYREAADKIWEVIVKGKGGRIISTGEGAFSNRLTSFLPSSFIDLFLRTQDRLASLISPPPSTPRATHRSRPLPTQSTASIKKSGKPISRTTPTTSAMTESTTYSRTGIASSENDGVESLGSSIGTDGELLEESFVGSEAGWRDHEDGARGEEEEMR